jgi:hypothetical protein
VLVGLRDHRVREHGEDRPRGKCENEGDDVRGRSAGTGRSRQVRRGPRSPRSRSTARGSAISSSRP